MSHLYDNVILVDFDGVCANWESAFAWWMHCKGYTLPSVRTYELHHAFNITEKESRKLANEFNRSEFMSTIPPFKDAIKYIRKLHEEHGYVFHCFTAIEHSNRTFNLRAKNITNLFGPTAFQRLVLTGTSENKRKYLSEYDGSECYWIEDVTKNAKIGLEFGLQPILINHDYNKSDDSSGLQRVKNWEEIYHTIVG